MKRLLVLTLCCFLFACGNESVEVPQAVATPSAVISQDFSAIKDFNVVNSGFREYQGQPAAWVMFTKPIDRHINLNQFIHLRNKEGALDGAWQLDKAGNNAYYLNIKPAHQYTIVIDKGVPSFDQQSLTLSAQKTFTSPDISAGATFLHQGSILNPDFSDGLPVMVVNTPWVDVEYYRVKPQHYLNFLHDNPTSTRYAWSLEELEDHATLITTQKYDTGAPTNHKTKQVLSTSHISELKQPGLYLAVLRSGGQYQKYQFSYFNVSTLGVEVREYKDNFLVTVIEQNTASPAANVEAVIYRKDKKSEPNRLVTDKLGQVLVPKNLDPRLIALTKDSNFNLISLSAGKALDLSDFSVDGVESRALELFIFGPRDLYRRGEAITYYALLRDRDGKQVKPLPLPTSLTDPNGNEIANTLTKATDGLLEFNHQFGNDALTGRYELRFTIGEQVYQKVFHVEDFMPQRMELDIVKQAEPLQNRGIAKQALEGRFLYGAPASEHKVDGMVQLKTTDSALDALPGYYFGSHTDMGTLNSYQIDNITLDSTGLGELSVEDRWSKLRHAVSIEGYAYLYETGGRKVSAKFKQLWWPKASMLGIKPQFKALTSASNQGVGFKLLRSDITGALASDEVLVSLVRHHQEYYWQHSEQEGWQRLERNDVYPVWQQELSLDNQQALEINVPVEWGKYQLVVKSLADNSQASLFFEAGERWYWRWAENNGNSVRPDQIEIALDKASYQQGDSAQVKIDAPYAGTAWLRIESDKLLWQQQVTLNKGQNNVAIAIEDWQRHDVYLSAYLISPSSKTTPLKRALGLAHLPLDRAQRELAVTINAPTKVTPDKLVPLSVNIANASATSQVVLAAVDVGILSLHQFKTPDPLSHFFAKRQYGVSIEDNFSQIIAPNQLDKAKVLWGGGAELARGGEQAQSSIQIVSYLSQPQTVDNDGNAHFELPLPYFNGRLRVFAIAFDQQRFGSTSQPLTVAADLVSQINMPRFLAVGDMAQFKLDLTNTTDASMTFDVTVAAEDLQLDNASQQVTLAPGKKITLPLTISAKKVTAQAQVKLNIDGDNLAIKRQWSIAVRPAYPAQRIAKTLLLDPNQTHQFSLDAPQWNPQTQSSISIASRAQFDLTSHINGLYQFPLGCLEQTSSRLYPWLVLPPKTQQQLGEQLSHINRDTLINDGIKRILSLQTYNGALSLWHSDGREHPWLSAYGAQVLLQAQQNGVYVEQAKLEKLLKRLSYYLRRANFSTDEGAYYRFSTRAYSALVLAKLGRANQSHMRQLLKSLRHSRSPLPVVQLAIAFKVMGDSERSTSLINSAMKMNYQSHYDPTYGSKVRDNAMIISLLLNNNVAASWAQQLSFDLWKQLQSRQWFSTQERLALVLADAQLAKHFDSPFDYQLAVADATFSGPDAMSAFYRVDGNLINQTSITNDSAQALYINTVNQGYPVQPPTQQEEGLTIRRDYYDMQGKLVNVAQVTSGQRLLVRINVQSLQDNLKDIMVVDLLPAGFEIERGDLSEQLDLYQLTIDGKTLNQRISNYNIDYQGVRDDRYIAAVSVNYRRATELFYIVQAVTPGVYQLPPVMGESMYRDDIRAVGSQSHQVQVK